MEIVNKKQLGERLAEKFDMTPIQGTEIVSLVFDEMSGILAHGGTVEIAGFGKFSVRERKERAGHNPRTKEKIIIPASKVPHFQAGAVLKRRCKAEK